MTSMRTWAEKKSFWILLIIISLGGLFFSYHYFPKAFAILNIEISMDRHEALVSARQLAQKFGWSPESFQEAAAFHTDDEIKNFIELEGGGTAALNTIIKERWYSPYYWSIRHFKEHDAHETTINFMPNGTPYGFVEKFPEDMEGAAFSSHEARKIAEKNVLENWHIDLKNYALAESSQEVRQSGRIDHEFVYDRIDKTVNDAPFQIHIGVSGDKLSSLSYSIKVPDAFKRRYEHMRSANNIIAFAALFFISILYLGFGCLAGLAFLMRRHSLLWRPALIAGFFIALLQVLNVLNQLPLQWMEYETALSKTSFYMQLATSMLVALFFYTGLLTLIFAVSEGLTRYAFGNQLKLWSLWNTSTASSLEVLGRTLGGYLILGFDLGFVTLMYAFASKYLGWWTPAETLFNPNILAAYVPWFSSLAQSLLAGFMEECLSRALPLAGAALLGAYYGRRTLFISVAFVAQALIFGAAHANYPAQPAYARLVELMIPSFVFGGIYLQYGLLPSILSHVIFDVFWFALPLFLSTAAGIWIDKSLVIFLSFIPIWIIIYARIKTGSFRNAPANSYNAAEQPDIPDHVHHEEKHYEEETQKSHPLTRKNAIALLILACISIGAWGLFTQFKQNNVSLKISKRTALKKAQEYLSQRNHELSQPPWTPLVSAEAEISEHDRFIWQVHGKKLYQELMGSYLTPATWKIRFAQFEGDLIERAQEYGILINGEGSPIRFAHAFPESAPGATLTEKQARAKAHEIIKNEFNINPADLEEISAISHKHPARLDWVFTFKDPSIDLAEGQARISVSLAGDKQADAEQFVFVPEQWQRADKHYQTILSIISVICRLLLLIAILLYTFLMLKNWRHADFSTSVFSFFAIVIGLKATLQAINIWPFLQASFLTTEPYNHQAIKIFGWLFLQIISQAIVYGVGAAIATGKIRHQKIFHRSQDILIALGCGFALAALRALAPLLVPSVKPLWADYSYAPALIPSIGFALSALTSYISGTIILLLITKAADHITSNWRSRKALGFAWIIGLIFAINGLSIDSIAMWIVSGIFSGTALAILYYFFIRMHRNTLPLIGAVTAFLAIAQQAAFNPYPGALLGSALSFIMIGIIAYWWSDKTE